MKKLQPKKKNADSGAKKLFVSKYDLSKVIVRPRITEKAAYKAESNVSVFEIADWASKSQVSKAIKEIYKITPVRVTTSKIPPKNVTVRGKAGVKSGIKKAYVFLKKGDKIELI